MATRTGTITAFPNKHGATDSSYSYDTDFFDGDGSSYFYTYSTSKKPCILYGFNFNELQELNNNYPVKITGLKLSISAKQYNSSSTYVSVRFVSNFKTSGLTTSEYTDLGDNSITMIDGTITSSYTVYEKADFPNTLNWINSNLDDFFNGYSTNSFGIRLYGNRFYINKIYLTVTYEYEGGGVNEILFDNVKPKKFFIDTNEVKAILVDTTKVYG